MLRIHGKGNNKHLQVGEKGTIWAHLFLFSLKTSCRRKCDAPKSKPGITNDSSPFAKMTHDPHSFFLWNVCRNIPPSQPIIIIQNDIHAFPPDGGHMGVLYRVFQHPSRNRVIFSSETLSSDIGPFQIHRSLTCSHKFL